MRKPVPVFTREESAMPRKKIMDTLSRCADPFLVTKRELSHPEATPATKKELAAACAELDAER